MGRGQHRDVDGLSLDRSKEPGAISERMIERFVRFGRYGHDMGADGILITCSAFGPAIDRLIESVPVPVLKPNEAMFRAAIAQGARIGMLATFGPSVGTMTDEFEEFVAEIAPGSFDRSRDRPSSSRLTVSASGQRSAKAAWIGAMATGVACRRTMRGAMLCSGEGADPAAPVRML
ncbi:aspartate/glutamate racemase family protein [Methylobacterium organophilum]|nr:aspartate/glutamate racemase family protein [Methylobacterium organophilum]